MKIITLIILTMLTIASIEPIEDIASSEEGKPFLCNPGESSKACALRALHEEIFNEKSVVMKL